MSKKKNTHSSFSTKTPKPAAGVKPKATPQPRMKSVNKYFSSRWIYGIGFILMWIFTSWTYGDVFSHIAAENYFSFERLPMDFVLRRDGGEVFWVGRFLLLGFQNQWFGGFLLALILTVAAWLSDIPFRHNLGRAGIGFLPSLAALGYMVYRGFNLYVRHEVSVFLIISVGLLLLAAAFAFLFSRLCRNRDFTIVRTFPTAAVFALCGYGALTYFALTHREDVRLTCRMQNQLDKENWEGMIETARSAQRPTRSMAALHALGLLRSNRLLQELFEIPYDFPELDLEDIGGTNEFPLFLADCNLHAGLVNAAYRTSMENTVLIGPRVSQFKRMAVCAILNGEKKLAKRYLNLIEKMPFEQKFIEKYAPMLEDASLIEQDPTLKSIKELAPLEEKFEQNYPPPAFLGYNSRMLVGSNASLITSIATCLYSKDLDNLLSRAHELRKKTTLPHSVLQALAIAYMKNPNILETFPEITQTMVFNELQAFMGEAVPYLEQQFGTAAEKKEESQEEMRGALKENWMGSYMYYYYCGNLSAPQHQSADHAVN